MTPKCPYAEGISMTCSCGQCHLPDPVKGDVLPDQSVLRVSAAAGAMPPMLSDAYKEIARLRAEVERLKAPEGWEDELNAAWSIVNKVRAENERLRDALTTAADHHHRTKVGSRLHDPQNQDWTDCPCLTCRGAKEALETPRASDEQEASHGE